MRPLISRTILVLLLHVVSGEGENKSDRDTLELVLPLSCREVILQSATDPISCAMVSCRIYWTSSLFSRLPRFLSPPWWRLLVRRMAGRFQTWSGSLMPTRRRILRPSSGVTAHRWGQHYEGELGARKMCYADVDKDPARICKRQWLAWKLQVRKKKQE